MKKTFLLVTLFFCLGVTSFAQNVNIPDATFKAVLVANPAINTNGDSEIQVSEANAFSDTINVNIYQITDLTGIEAFIQLNALDCGSIGITALDVSNNTALTYLRCEANQLTSLDVSNNLGLITLTCEDNLLTSLNVANNTNLQFLYCWNNALNSLDVSNNLGLINLHCDNTQLTSLDVSNNTALKALNCEDNQLTSLDVSNNPALKFLYCDNNQLTSLDLSNNPDLMNFWCADNQLTSLDLSNNPNLVNVRCLNNQLISLDVSNTPVLQILRCENNQLLYLFLKGSRAGICGFCTLNFSANPGLQYVCASPSLFNTIQQKINQYGYSNVEVNDFCTYPPGGSYNTVSGVSIYDGDVNGCTLNDSIYPFMRLMITQGTDTAIAYGNIDGLYEVFLDSGTYTLTPQLETPMYFTTNPLSNTVYFPDNNNNSQLQDYCIIPNSVFPDVEVIMLYSPATPGFDANYHLIYHNKGTTLVSGNITLDFPGSKMNFVSSSVNPAAQTANQLTWNYSNLLPLQSHSVDITMYILPPPINNIGDVLQFTANIPLTGDTLPADNIFTLSQIEVGSFDPNDKTCLEGRYLNNSQIGEYLHYLVRFQNTGTAYADHVVIVDTLNLNEFDISSFQFIEASHPVHTNIHNGVLQFYFEDIQLADSFSNEPESHGYVAYKIKTKGSLAPYSTVSNKADIYFDFNAPVLTNSALTTFGGITSFVNTSSEVSCFGGSDGSLELTPSGGVIPYTFSIGGTFQSNAIFSNLSAGIYQAIVKDALGFSDTLMVTIGEPTLLVANATAPSSLCISSTTDVTVSATGGTAPYTGLGTFTVSSGVYSYIITDSHGCIDTVLIEILAQTLLPIANFTSTAGGQAGNFVFTNSSLNGTSYLWDFGNGATDTNMNAVYTYNTNGTYNVMLIVSNDCGSDTVYQTLNVSTLELDNATIEGGIRVYPNPSSETLHFKWDKPLSQNVTIAIYNSTGQIVAEQNVAKNLRNKDISVAAYPAGIYFYYIPTTLQSGKFVVEK